MEVPAPSPDAEFGARLYAALRAQGLPFGTFDYAATQALKSADRDEAVALFRRHVWNMSYTNVQALKSDTPEQFAERMAALAKKEAADRSLTLLMLLVLT